MAAGRDEAGPARRRRPPWGLLGMLGLVALIEWTLAGHDLDFTSPMQWDWRVIGRAATRPERVANRDVLLFGDSLVKFGLMPRIIQERSGKRAYNFALHTGQASTSYFMLRRALTAGARPSAVVLDLTPHMLAHAPAINKNLWAELLSPWECLDLAWSSGNSDFFASTMISRVLPTYKERYEIRASIMAAVEGKSASRRYQIPIFRRNWKMNDGAQLMGDCPAPSINADQCRRELYPVWAPHPVNVAYLDRFLELASSRGIPVYWLLTPIHPDLQAMTEASGYNAAHTGFVREVQARFPATIIVDARGSGFPADFYMDGVHVNRRGALQLSAAMAEVLREEPLPGKSGRWIALDRGNPVKSPIEDLIQSDMALQAEYAKARR